MKIPKWVKCGPVKWQIKVTKTGYTSEDDCYYGETDLRGAVIRLHPDLSDDLTASTLMHELLHCCFAQSSLYFEDEDEEKVIRAIEPMLVDTLRRAENQPLRDYLFGD